MHLLASIKLLKLAAGKAGVGFNATLQTAEDKNRKDIFADVMPEDLLKFGMIPEFIGRLPVLTSVENLDKPALDADSDRTKECSG